MIIRKIKPEEIKRTSELFSIAFEYETDNHKSAQQVYEEIAANPCSREDAYWQERWAAFADDNQTMMGFMVAKPFPVYFDGHHMTMTGIGGVSTLPQYRRQGCIRACFETALPKMYEEGVAFSYLYPFSTAYYRKFGYELCCQRIRYQIQLHAIPYVPTEGDCYLVEPGCLMSEDIRQIYQTWQNRYNMMIENEDYEYAWIAKSNPPKDQVFTYVYKDKTGTPKGFFSYHPENNGDNRNLRCIRFFFTDLEGFHGLMNLARNFAADHHAIIFELPEDICISPLFPEWSMGAGTRELLFCGMARVIHVQKVLLAARYQGSGQLTLEIRDALISENNHCFSVTYENGIAITVSITEKSPDMTLDIQDFSRLIIGTCDTSAIKYLESVQIHNDNARFSDIFYKKPVLITEFF